MRAIIPAVILMLMPMTATSQPALSRADVEDIVWSILSTRQAILRDSTPVNFCAWPAAFDDRGQLLGVRSGAARMFVPIADCARSTDARARFPNVRVRSVTVLTDTTVVRTETDRGGLQYWDEYRCAREDRFMNCRYSLIGWQEK